VENSLNFEIFGHNHHPKYESGDDTTEHIETMPASYRR